MANPFILPTKLMWRFGDKKKIVLYVFLSCIAQSIFFLGPLVIAWLLNTIQTEGITNPWKLIGIAALLPLIELGFWLFHAPSRYIESTNAFIAEANYRKYLVEGTMNLPAEWHTAHHSGDTIDRINKASRALKEYSQFTFFTIEAIFRLVSGYIALMFFNLHSIYIVAFFTLIAITTVVKADKILSKKYRTLFEFENKISAKIFDAISNITTVIVLKIEKLLAKGIWKAILEPFPTYKKTLPLTELKWFIVAMSGALMLFCVLTTYILTNSAEVLVGTLYILFGYVQRITFTFFNFAFRYSEIVRNEVQIKNALPIEKEFTQTTATKQTPMNNWKTLDVDNLSFSYDTEEGDLHLNDVHFTFKKGERIALVGESGSGKTTFLKLLRGLYQPQQANIKLDNKPLTSFNQLSDAIILIPQEPELFATTVKENITLGTDVTEKELNEATTMSTFSKVVPRLPRGYDSNIAERGVNLSGGEKQRLALARGLLFTQEKQILLLDEPTSSVDSKNEIEIFEAIFKKHKGKTILASVHRLNLLKYFDRIFYFENGELKARGTLNELKSNSNFAKVYEKYSS